MSVTKPIIRMIVAGTTMEFSGQRVVDAVLLEEISLISTEVPISTLEFQVITLDDSFSMFSGSTFELLSERLPVRAYELIDLEQRFLGKFYLDDWKNTSERVFWFSAIDIIGVMEATAFDGVFWLDPVTLADALAQTLTPISVEFEVDDAVAEVEISGWIPPGNYRGALQQMLFAAGAVATTARSEKLLINPVKLPLG